MEKRSNGDANGGRALQRATGPQRGPRNDEEPRKHKASAKTWLCVSAAFRRFAPGRLRRPAVARHSPLHFSVSLLLCVIPLPPSPLIPPDRFAAESLHHAV